MTKPLAARSTYWRRLTVDALTAIAGLALAFAAVNATVDALQQVLLAAVLMATAVIVEPHRGLRLEARRPRHAGRPSRTPA